MNGSAPKHHLADCNWPFGPPEDAEYPDEPDADPPEPDTTCEQAWSIVACRTQTQTLASGSPGPAPNYAPRYTSARMPGYRAAYTLEVPLTDDTPQPVDPPDARAGQGLYALRTHLAARSR